MSPWLSIRTVRQDTSHESKNYGTLPFSLHFVQCLIMGYGDLYFIRPAHFKEWQPAPPGEASPPRRPCSRQHEQGSEMWHPIHKIWLVRVSRTTSHKGDVDFEMGTFLINWQTKGCWPTSLPSNPTWQAVEDSRKLTYCQLGSVEKTKVTLVYSVSLPGRGWIIWPCAWESRSLNKGMGNCRVTASLPPASAWTPSEERPKSVKGQMKYTLFVNHALKCNLMYFLCGDK